jgi:short-subunit dehydrogenase
LVNNSGFGLFGKNSELAHEMIEKMIILNAVSTTSLCRLYGNEMAKNGLGYILNVASTAAYQPIPYFAAYSASKSYLMNFSKALHHELKHSNVKVTCLNPGPTETNFFEIALNGKKFPAFNLKPMMSAKEVAQVGIDAMFDGKTVVVAGTLNYIFSKILPFIPLTIVERFLTIFAKDKFISANT